MTVLEVLTAATGYLQKNGVESPRLNAEHLLAHVLGKKRLDLYMEFDRPLSDAERARSAISSVNEARANRSSTLWAPPSSSAAASSATPAPWSPAPRPSNSSNSVSIS